MALCVWLHWDTELLFPSRQWTLDRVAPRQPQAEGQREVTMKRKLSEARLSKILREMKKREPPSIEYCDLKQKSEREELEELLAMERTRTTGGSQ